MGENKIFVTCDASDWRTGAPLSVGKTWETACPVAFDSMQFKGPELNYPVHEKELLAIIRALRKWRSDLLGGQIYVYTDHRTLEIFHTQRELSRRQLRWQEYLSQYEMTIVYIRGEDNTVADVHPSWSDPHCAVCRLWTGRTWRLSHPSLPRISLLMALGVRRICMRLSGLNQGQEALLDTFLGSIDEG
jgi:hypothetical protein